MIIEVAERILVDVRVDQPQLALVNPAKRVVDLRAAGADGLHLGAEQLEPGLEFFLHEKIAQRLAVANFRVAGGIFFART